MKTTEFKIGDIVRPANNGETSSGEILYWTRNKGRVMDTWTDCGEQRVQVSWFKRSPYPTILPAYFLKLA